MPWRFRFALAALFTVLFCLLGFAELGRLTLREKVSPPARRMRYNSRMFRPTPLSPPRVGPSDSVNPPPRGPVNPPPGEPVNPGPPGRL